MHSTASIGGREVENVVAALVRSVLQIKTTPGGYNSGRAYYIRSESSDCQDMVAELKALAKAARVREDKRTRFENNQLQVRGCRHCGQCAPLAHRAGWQWPGLPPIYGGARACSRAPKEWTLQQLGVGVAAGAGGGENVDPKARRAGASGGADGEDLALGGRGSTGRGARVGGRGGVGRGASAG
jgi:hypothetical protein